MSYPQAAASSRTLFLALGSTPALSVPYTDLTVRYKKQGQNTMTLKPMTAGDWVELGNGLYSISFSANEMDTVGGFTYTVESGSSLFDNFLYDEFTIEAAVAGTTAPLPQQCVVYGNLANQSALAPQHIKIVARPVQFPAKYGQTILAADAVWTYADAYGDFTLSLVRNSICVVEIERTGIKAQITVPDSPTANLIDLLPAFVADYTL